MFLTLEEVTTAHAAGLARGGGGEEKSRNAAYGTYGSLYRTYGSHNPGSLSISIHYKPS